MNTNIQDKLFEYSLQHWLGGVCLGFSDAHYGHPRNMIKTEPADNMGDGWETARRLDRPAVLVADQAGILQVPGHEWAVFRLGMRGTVSSVTLDTNHFKVIHQNQCCNEYLNSLSWILVLIIHIWAIFNI